MGSELYPKTAKDAVDAWDRGEPVWTVEMGGVGPGYEQTIQLLIFELMRAFHDHPIANKKEEWTDEEAEVLLDAMTKETLKITRRFQLGTSGAQAGAARSATLKFIRWGYREMVAKAEPDRRIMAAKERPGEKEEAQGEEIRVRHTETKTE